MGWVRVFFSGALGVVVLLSAKVCWGGTPSQGAARDLLAETEIEKIDLPPTMLQESPVLRRWLQGVPDVGRDISNEPSFKTRVRLGYSQFPSNGDAGGWNLGVEDLFIGHTALTLSGEYQAAFNGVRRAYGGDVRYYVRPLGSYINFGPVLGYRHLETEAYSRDGVNIGARLMLVLSRSGAADVSLTQTWVKPASGEDVGITTFSAGYAVSRNLRISADIQKQNSSEAKDSRVGVVLEWMP